MEYTKPLTELIQTRFSCRTYQDANLAPDLVDQLQDWIASLPAGPFGNPQQFKIIASQPEDTTALSGLGTYGFIKNPAGFILGKSGEGPGQLEDYGYLMEAVILKATELELGTCWLGGTFTRSRFTQEINLSSGEIIPAVVSLGRIAETARRVDQTIRNAADSDQRLPFETLFFRRRFNQPLTRQEADSYALPLDMVRLGPSASNKQPWRVVQKEQGFHFYLQRTPGYPRRLFGFLLQLADLQRLDLGIALAHFELTCREHGLPGTWQVRDPELKTPTENTEYIASWHAR